MWDQIAALSSAIGAIATAAAAWAAVRAIKAAMDIDRRNAERAADREFRDSLPLAIALLKELEHVRSLAQSIPSLLDRAGIAAVERVAAVSRAREQYRAPILESSIRELGCFPAPIGIALGVAHSAISNLQLALSLRRHGWHRDEDWDSGQVPEAVVAAAARHMTRWQQPCVDALDLALERLRAFAVDAGYADARPRRAVDAASN